MSSVLDTWSEEVVFVGATAECIKYISGNNVYGLGYSKLRLMYNNDI